MSEIEPFAKTLSRMLEKLPAERMTPPSWKEMCQKILNTYTEDILLMEKEHAEDLKEIHSTYKHELEAIHTISRDAHTLLKQMGVNLQETQSALARALDRVEQLEGELKTCKPLSTETVCESKIGPE